MYLCGLHETTLRHDPRYLFLAGFVTVNGALVTWFTIVEDRFQSTLD